MKFSFFVLKKNLFIRHGRDFVIHSFWREKKNNNRNTASECLYQEHD